MNSNTLITDYNKYLQNQLEQRKYLILYNKSRFSNLKYNKLYTYLGWLKNEKSDRLEEKTEFKNGSLIMQIAFAIVLGVVTFVSYAISITTSDIDIVHIVLFLLLYGTLICAWGYLIHLFIQSKYTYKKLENLLKIINREIQSEESASLDNYFSDSDILEILNKKV